MRVARWGLGLVLVVAACGGAAKDERATAAAVDPNNAALLAEVRGQVSVRKADGAVVPAVPEMTLARADTLITGSDGRAVVVLHNGYVIGVDASLEQRVEKIMHFDDPPTAQSLAQQFEQALGPGQVDRDKLERIAGWNARRAAGETPAPVSKERADAPQLEAEVARDQKSDIAAPTLADPVTPEENRVGDAKFDAKTAPVENKGLKPKLEKKKSDAPPKPIDPLKNLPGRGEDPGAGLPDAGGGQVPQPRQPETEHSTKKAEEGDLDDAWVLETGANGQVTRTKLPTPLASRRAALAACLVGAGETRLVLTVVGGEIKAAKFGAKPAECARELVGVKLDVGDATVTVRLRK